MKSRRIGLVILIAVIAIVVGYTFLRPDPIPEVAITGKLGGEKIGLYENPEFQEILEEKYGLTMDYRKAGSFDMVTDSLDGQDYLFPSSQLALEAFNQSGNSSYRDEIIFNTPIVLYSYQVIVDALEQEGIVSNREGSYYVDMPALAEAIVEEKQWQDIGLNQFYGNILVDTTDPSASNSGHMFLGLLANALNDNRVVSQGDVEALLPDIQKIYNSIGFMNTSSADMFKQFLTLGVGQYKIVAGYESQLLEFSVQEPETYASIKDDVVILYPEPTVWSSHIFIAVNEDADVAIDALLDEQIQEISWKDHGYRTIVANSGAADQFDVPGLAQQVTQIMNMPDYQVMTQLVDGIQ
ncbi:substrate-binding domain-containing protein [Aerococcaceae bacterium DSM 111022]|nr:substrate-binding domain-containing protein [Aerococcaceae bacterium DSM 111022]